MTAFDIPDNERRLILAALAFEASWQLAVIFDHSSVATEFVEACNAYRSNVRASREHE